MKVKNFTGEYMRCPDFQVVSGSSFSILDPLLSVERENCDFVFSYYSQTLINFLKDATIGFIISSEVLLAYDFLYLEVMGHKNLEAKISNPL